MELAKGVKPCGVVHPVHGACVRPENHPGAHVAGDGVLSFMWIADGQTISDKGKRVTI